MTDLSILHEELEKQACRTVPSQFVRSTAFTSVATMSEEMDVVENRIVLKTAEIKPVMLEFALRQILIRRVLVFTTYLACILLSEMLTTIFNPIEGLVCYAFILFGLFVQSALSQNLVDRRMLATLALAPLIRILSLSLPLNDYIAYLQYLVVGIPLLLSAWLVTRYTRYHFSYIGFIQSSWPVQLLVGLTGIGLGFLEYLILQPSPLINNLTLSDAWAPAIILLVFTGLLEEFIFRGLMQKAFIAGLGKIKGLFYVSFLFASLHLGYHSVIDILFVFVVALLFGWVALRTRSILGVILAHGLTNICLFLVFPFLIH